MRKIYGLLRPKYGDWSTRTNYELEKLTNGATIRRFVRAQTLKWLGHIMRMEGKGIMKNITDWKLMRKKDKGKPRKICTDYLLDDMKVMKMTYSIKNSRIR